MKQNITITVPITEWQELKALVLETRTQLSKLVAESGKELLTPAEVCRMLKIGKSTYQRYVIAEVFEQTKIGKGKNSRVYVKRSEIEKLIDEGKI